MQIAQKLYEGIALGGHTEGLISYMRTDSTRLSQVFVNDAFAYIESEFGKEYKGKARQKMTSMHRMLTKQFDRLIFIIHRKSKTVFNE